MTLISRGYGAEQGSRNDEALGARHLLPDACHTFRIPIAWRPHEWRSKNWKPNCCCWTMLSNIAALFVTWNIVLLDALEPFGFNPCIPAWSLLRRANRRTGNGLTSSSSLDQTWSMPRMTREEIRRIAARLRIPNAAWVEAAHAPIGLVASGDSPDEPCLVILKSLRGQKVAAFFARFRQSARLSAYAFELRLRNRRLS